jgi:K+-transporting ATPase KdpF subunit
MNATIVLAGAQNQINISTEYILGAFIALFILGYLFYTLIKPEEF